MLYTQLISFKDDEFTAVVAYTKRKHADWQKQDLTSSVTLVETKYLENTNKNCYKLFFKSTGVLSFRC